MSLAEERMIVRVPASTANLGSGFDSIGIALQLYLTLEVEKAEKTHFVWKGKDLEGLEISEEDNLILQAILRLYSLCNQNPPQLRIEVSSEIPLTRGLGSSASAYVGGLVIANELLGHPFTIEELLWLATEEEGHPDNVGASLLGGVVMASVDWDQKKVVYHKQSFPIQWKWIAAIPSYTLSTALARNLLPEQYPKQDAIYNLSRYGMLVSSLMTGNRAGMKMGLQDALHQPYRSQLIPGFEELLRRQDELNMIGFVISGAGPTVLGLMEEVEDHEQVVNEMRNVMTIAGHTVEVFPLAVDQEGFSVQRVAVRT
ncbi:homoserine kinase [Caldalkalibacillus mannanilyticus]|uniref:homoserine kinase n=1 Tax=Caldalkalibacillus mannanilyticus TaxID=1418 RepID=UPI000468B661|nr:homoserine kinase [Caldalkalibacillus mannanilyticus]